MKYLPISILFTLTLFMNSCTKEDDTLCVESTWYQDADGDGLGNPNVTESACERPNGYVANSNDADDTMGSTSPVSSFGNALDVQIANGDGNGIDNYFRNSGVVVNESANTYFAVNGVHPINSGDYSSYYPKSIVEASLETDEIVNVWSFDANTLGREVDMEGLCFAEGTDFLYIGDEYNYVYELNLNTGTITREWNLADIGISTATDRGVEAITYHEGYFYVGIQAEQRVHQLDLHLDAIDPNAANYQRVESISSFAVANSPSGLHATSDGSIFMVAVGGSGQNIYKYSTSGVLSCTINLDGNVDLQRADGIYIDSNQEYVYVADSQGALNGLYGMYKITWSLLNCQ